MESIQKFVEEATQPKGRLHEIYLRNFRELVKLIPMVGSLIDANVFGAIADRNLNERLVKLEDACARALLESDSSLLKAEIASINGQFAVLVLTNLQEFRDWAEGSLNGLAASVKQLSEATTALRPHPSFRFVTISGASAVGKDCLLDYIAHNRCKTARRIEMLRKFTTREPRPVDSKYYDFVTDEEFDLLERSGGVLFPYYKRGFRYGFDKAHFAELAEEDCHAFCVFTSFSTFPSDRQVLRDKGVYHIAILLEASEECLILRSNARLLKPDDLERRKESISHDLGFLRENSKFRAMNFDVIINNSDKYSKEESYNRLVTKIGLQEMTLDLDEGVVEGACDR